MNMKKLGVLLILFLLVLIIFIVGCAKEIKEEPKTEVQKKLYEQMKNEMPFNPRAS